jgi:hypothetical protein
MQGDRAFIIRFIGQIRVDDNSDADLLLLSGNRKLPPNDWMTPVVEAIRLCENRFMRCVKEWK